MAQLVLNRIDDETLAGLSELAKANRISVHEQAERILVGAVDSRDRRWQRLEIADRIAAMTPKGVVQTDSTILLREDRDR